MSFNPALMLRETAQASPGKAVALFDSGQLTYGELDRQSDQLAAGLAAADLRPGDAVALQLPNVPQFLVSYFGVLKAGCVVSGWPSPAARPSGAYPGRIRGALRAGDPGGLRDDGNRIDDHPAGGL
ncbi:MAG: AMP-binding protein [Actinomycetota bacterium]